MELRTIKINLHHRNIAHEILVKHRAILAGTEIPAVLSDDIAEEIQKAFNLGFRAASQDLK